MLSLRRQLFHPHDGPHPLFIHLSPLTSHSLSSLSFDHLRLRLRLRQPPLSLQRSRSPLGWPSCWGRTSNQLNKFPSVSSPDNPYQLMRNLSLMLSLTTVLLQRCLLLCPLTSLTSLSPYRWGWRPWGSLVLHFLHPSLTNLCKAQTFAWSTQMPHLHPTRRPTLMPPSPASSNSHHPLLLHPPQSPLLHPCLSHLLLTSLIVA